MSLIINLTVIAGVFCLWFHLFGFACGNGLYSIVAPGAILPNRDFKITVAIYQIQEPVTIKVGITGPSYNGSQEVELHTSRELKGVTFKVPDLTKGDYSLTAEGISGLKFQDSIGLYFKRDDPLVFILLDKDDYRPGDRINYRVLVLNEQLRPDLYAGELVICLLDPERIVVDKARNSKVVDGVYSGYFQLSRKAALGQWELNIEDSEGEEYRAHTSTFNFFDVIPDEVPGFSIQLDVPKYASIQDDAMKIVVKAKHSYGSPVNGKGIININLKTEEKRNHLFNKTITANGVLVKGQAVFNINLADVAKHISPIESTYLATINATVKDDISGEEISKVSKVYLLSHRHIITCADQSCMRPWREKDNKVFIKIANLDGSLVNDTQSVVKLIYSEGTEKVKPYFRKYIEDDAKKNVYEFVGHLDKSGLYVFTANLSDLPQEENNWPYYDISAEYKGERYELQKTHTPTVGLMIDVTNAYFTPQIDVNFFLQIHGPKDSKGFPAALTVGDEFLVTVNSKEPISYFIYNIVARGLILHTERVELAEPKVVYNFTLKATHLFSPHFYIFAYFVDDKGILQYTNSQYIVTVTLPNEISISAPNTGCPGEEIELKIKTEPDSFVGVLALDERISDIRIRDFNKLRDIDLHLDANQLLNALSDMKLPTQWPRNYHIDISRLDEHLRDYHLHTYKKVPGSKLGLITMTNAKIEKRQFRPFDIDTDVSPRKRFAKNDKSLGPPLDPMETWLFTDIKKTNGEVTELVTKLPDSLGTWAITGISLHPEKGLGVFQSNVTKIKTFQPYSVSMRLPISVKFGESISVPVVIVNHLPDPLNIEIEMDKESYAYEIEEFGARSVDLGFSPKWFGYFPLDFTIISSAKNTTVDESLRVTLEGNTQYRNRAILINLKDNEEYSSSFHIDFPKEMILDSDHVGFTLFGDPLGTILSNLDSSLPSGSGELTMSKMVVNFLVWDYLKGNQKLDDELDSQIQNNLREGYQNILNYRHEDGSFSYFGPPTDNGSIWLTSYVVRYLSEIKKIIYIDDNVLTTGFEFLLSRQKDDGSFTEDFEYFAEADRPVFFTASVLLGLQKQDNPNMEAINKAVTFLGSQMAKTNNLQLPESIAIYAIQKLKAENSGRFVAELKSLSKEDEDRIWWAEDVQKPSHQDVEITSYSLLSLMESEQILAESAINTVRWLLAQRNTDGEFASSQQTVVGLTALIKFANKFGYKADGWVISISDEIRSNKLVIKHDTNLISQSVSFSSDTRYVEIQAKGTGAVLIQISHQYDLEEKEANPSYRIQTTVKPRTLSSKLELNVCVDFVEKSKLKKSGMAILEVSLPSGYISDKSSYKQILDIERVRFVDTKNEKTVVMVYFESLAKNEKKCIPIEAYRAFVVTNLKPSKVLIYDNYGRKSTENYQVESELSHF